jgi:hypothetical protein
LTFGDQHWLSPLLSGVTIAASLLLQLRLMREFHLRGARVGGGRRAPVHSIHSNTQRGDN